MILKLQIDLSRLPHYKTEPDEAATILREAADWLEKRSKIGDEPYPATNTTKKLRNFESQECGFIFIG
jgi:hypothetical protein